MTASSRLETLVFTSPARVMEAGAGTFSPVTSTIVMGPTEAVAIDTQFIRDQVDAFADLIEGTGRRLTTIFVTHGHADHYFGIDRLSERFPGVRVVATHEVVEDIRANLKEHVARFMAWIGDDLVVPTSIPEPLVGDTIRVDGEALNVITVEQADVSPTAILFAPSIGTVVAGDLAYDSIHQMLGLTRPAEWERWIASIEVVEALEPHKVIVGHRPLTIRDEDASRILAQSKTYIRDFAAAVKISDNARDVIGRMKERYPEHGNVATLYFSANAVFPPHQ